MSASSLLLLLLLGAGIGFFSSTIITQFESGHGSADPDFTLGSTPGTLSVPQGQLAVFTLSLNSLNGFAGSANLNVSTNPTMPNATYSINPTSVSLFSGSATSSLTIAVPVDAPVKDYFLTLAASSGRLYHSVPIILQVTLPPQPDFQLQATQSSLNVTRGSSVSDTITLVSVGGFSGIVNMSATSSPGGGTSPTVAVNPTRITLLSGGTSSIVLTVTTTASTNRGGYSIVVQGISGSLSQAITISLRVS